MTLHFMSLTSIVMLSFYSRGSVDEIPSHNEGITIQYLTCSLEAMSAHLCFYLDSGSLNFF